MNKTLTPKIILIIVLVVLAGWTLYPPSKTLKPGIDLAGGTSLIYEIDTVGLTEADKTNLSQKMITVLQRRIDPANIQNLIWRPQGNNRFEVQMPLASAEAIEKRQAYDQAKKELLDKNVNRSRVIQALNKPAQERAALFAEFSQNDPNRLAILDNLAKVYDERMELQQKRDKLYSELENTEKTISSSGIDLSKVKDSREELISHLNNEQELRTALAKIIDVNNTESLTLLTGYLKTYDQWGKTIDQLSDIRTKYNTSMGKIDELILSEDRLDLCLESPPKSSRRQESLQKLKSDFPDRINAIDRVVAAYDQYSPYKGRLDDPRDLQRMLKGAGILEFRILPTEGYPGEDMAAMKEYVDRLQKLGPELASDNDYKWCDIENFEEWNSVDAQKRPTIVGQFGNKYYVLASNQEGQVMLHNPGERDWKLDRAFPTTDDIGRRAIGFVMDNIGGKLMSNVTGNNIGRPLCILLDGIAISAPNIEERISGQGRITGRFTQTQIEDMVNKLNAGSLPARLIEQPISINTIGPSIGADNRDQGIRAGFIGLIAVVACMAIYYSLSGTIADVALLLNLLFVLAVMAGIRATFTLPGIAGIILTIGMSVDANVLIFERIREEQGKGSSLRIAITNGYQKAFRTIFDSNLTTFITAAILYWRASEEVKGFAIVLMLGIASSMFTALFVTRVIFDLLLSRRIIKDHLFMLRLIHNPNVNWMRSRPIFFGISALLIIGGLAVFFGRNDLKNNKYDIEFTGGTSVQIDLKKGVELTRQQVEDKIKPLLAAANVYSVGDTGRRFEITTTETNKITATVKMPQAGSPSVQQVTKDIENAQLNYAGRLNNLRVTQQAGDADEFVITTSQMNQSLVKEVLAKAFPNADISNLQINEVVNDAIRNTFADELEVQQNLQPTIISEEKITAEMVDALPKLADFLGGIEIKCDLKRAASLEEINQRIRNLQFKPEAFGLEMGNAYQVFPSDLSTITEPNKPVNSFVYASVMPQAGLRNVTEEDREWKNYVQNEKSKVLEASQFETSLPRVRQFDPSVGAEQKTRALIAIILSLFAIIVYIWIRFGNLRYGIAAIIALVHDVSITLGAVAACTYLAATPIGEKLLIGDFKINLAMIAAFLTLIGYSLNDTIVVFDRIRENRGKARQLNPQTITDSINQTLSRTILTSFTTFIVVLIMYIFGGAGLRGFTFAIGLGIIVGTYSSIAIAAPILLIGVKTSKKQGK
jgi:SecD/SecF fusion protein